mgnify:CR=1 FL=1
MKIMGIDIGTTTVSIVLTDTETGKQLARETVEHNSFLQSSRPEQKIQDPGQIYEIVRELLAKMQGEHGLPDGIGFTGQMHGMLYVDASGIVRFILSLISTACFMYITSLLSSCRTKTTSVCFVQVFHFLKLNLWLNFIDTELADSIILINYCVFYSNYRKFPFICISRI